MKTPSGVVGLCHRASDAALLACGFLVIAASVMIGVEVVARKVFGVSLQGADELSGYVLAITSTWVLSGTLLWRRHIRIDSLYARLPRLLRLSLDIASLTAMVVFFGFVLRFGFDLFLRSFRLGSRAMTPLATPLAIPQGVWLLGLLLFLVVAIAVLVRAVMHWASGNVEAAMEMISNRSAEEEVADELEDVAEREALAAASGAAGGGK